MFYLLLFANCLAFTSWFVNTVQYLDEGHIGKPCNTINEQWLDRLQPCKKGYYCKNVNCTLKKIVRYGCYNSSFYPSDKKLRCEREPECPWKSEGSTLSARKETSLTTTVETHATSTTKPEIITTTNKATMHDATTTIHEAIAHKAITNEATTNEKAANETTKTEAGANEAIVNESTIVATTEHETTTVLAIVHELIEHETTTPEAIEHETILHETTTLAATEHDTILHETTTLEAIIHETTTNGITQHTTTSTLSTILTSESTTAEPTDIISRPAEQLQSEHKRCLKLMEGIVGRYLFVHDSNCQTYWECKWIPKLQHMIIVQHRCKVGTVFNEQKQDCVKGVCHQ